MIFNTPDRLRIPEAAYIHIPFCVSKCYYCDFNSYPGMESLFSDYVDALIREIRCAPEIVAGDLRSLTSVYFGGGTPTVLTANHLCEVLSAIEDTFGLAQDCEITTEANPGTVDECKYVQLYGCNFNRLSLGVQSLDDKYLAVLGRAHDLKEAIDAYQTARNVGFSNVSIDLMFALPGQTIDHWERTLEQAINLFPEHISLYELSIEEGTQFSKMCAKGELDLPDEDTQLAMYELTIGKLVSAGYEHYEVSNFAMPGFRSRHNQVYWHNGPHYGFGAGASSYVNGIRSRRAGNPIDYIKAINAGKDAVEFSESLSGPALAAETIGLGLRMLDGIDVTKITEKTQTDVLGLFADEIDRLRERGLVELSGEHIKVTHKGLLLLNDVAEEFLLCE